MHNISLDGEGTHDKAKSARNGGESIQACVGGANERTKEPDLERNSNTKIGFRDGPTFVLVFVYLYI